MPRFKPGDIITLRGDDTGIHRTVVSFEEAERFLRIKLDQEKHVWMLRPDYSEPVWGKASYYILVEPVKDYLFEESIDG